VDINLGHGVAHMKKRAFSIATDGSYDIGAVKPYPVAV